MILRSAAMSSSSSRSALSALLRRNALGRRQRRRHLPAVPLPLPLPLVLRSHSSAAAASSGSAWQPRRLEERRDRPRDCDYDHDHDRDRRPPIADEPDYDTLGPTSRLNLFTAINSAMRTAMRTDPSAIVFGEDVGFGGVFRCSQDLLEEFGRDRVFNTPLSENGIAGMAVGYASAGGTAIAEIQFADYIFPAFDQIVNEMAKFRFRSGNQWNCGGVTLRTPCGAVGHGALYHSQSPEAYLAHTPGIVVVMPRGPRCAKGLLLSSIRSKDPVVFLEPKILYRSAVEEVPDADYEIPLGKAEIVRTGSDVTIVGWGAQLRTLQATCDLAAREGVSCELIDLRTILPWDSECVVSSVRKTGKLIVSHEAPLTCGFGAEVVATLQQECFFHLEAPIQRVCGYDTPFGLVFEQFYLPDEKKNLDAIRRVMDYSK
ncbi:hypothetical protein ACHAW5_001739 [Stephanodiscus triporus]|uniref:3-methyl-2-oxobutanoate dehydrogenase (2-methylpropanoyl-transferring) n=1 Tax=Stephanodiscus triporus TaxID=2934178 RepID=A0ABD3QUV8_9STRA